MNFQKLKQLTTIVRREDKIFFSGSNVFKTVWFALMTVPASLCRGDYCLGILQMHFGFSPMADSENGMS